MFFEKINRQTSIKTDKKESQQKLQILGLNSSHHIDHKVIKRIIKKYCEQDHTYKFDNLNKINQFHENLKLPIQSNIKWVI